ncbi:hypothetical protein RFN29_30425 [Mesorhizobium sp. VK22B]|uniref:Uncharacterized protein n=1 Tax=Mesorhizobium captivum TaxID=3072319 RepID=A0ABU4Z9E3_9HYPH|nr:hypothetical protein [Mesorhizobium sp. VK22B]MDX8495866.1 hypothetical protein [Mesorhizobium sp. VK22B]
MKIEKFTTEDGKRIRHVLDPAEIDSLDEISGDEQLTLIWCDVHKKHEWHWLDRPA